MNLSKAILPVFISFSAGMVIAGAVFAFIAIIGVVPRLAQKTHTTTHIKLYEEAIIFGGIFGTLTMAFDFYIPIGYLAILYTLAIGIFFGCVAVSLAEILDVIPILTRRGRIQAGMFFFVLAIALGKLIGALLYYCIEGFYKQ